MLKYLFTAIFSDGTTYEQTPDDVSVSVKTKSQFFDVLQREKELVSFHVASLDNTRVASVNLLTGEFALNGLAFNLGDPRHPIGHAPLRLIFFRQHLHHISNSVETQHDVTYHVGYQWNDETGRNHQQTLQID